MKRFIEDEDFLTWKNDPDRMPLLLRGARQVGKSFLIEHWGKAHFEHLLLINFEVQKEYLACFESLDIPRIMPAVIQSYLNTFTQPLPAMPYPNDQSFQNDW